MKVKYVVLEIGNGWASIITKVCTDEDFQFFDTVYVHVLSKLDLVHQVQHLKDLGKEVEYADMKGVECERQ